MGSTATAERTHVRALVRPSMWLAVWIPLALLSGFQYFVAAEFDWIHGVLRRLYYLPIIIAAFRAGPFGGTFAAALATVLYAPHAFGFTPHPDAAPALDKTLDIILFNVVGAVAGQLARREETRRTQLQAALVHQQQLTDQLARAGRLGALGQLVAGIAHEIKNPLHALQGTAEVIDSVIPADCEERNMWTIHRRELSRLEDIALRFLSFARPKEPNLVDLDLRDVAHHLVDLVNAEARQHDIDVKLDEPVERVPVLGDRDQLAQIGLNIAVNAITALEGSHDGQIRVVVGETAARGRPHALLRVENNGPSIPEDTLETLFNPFFSGHEEGTGLGMAISSRIAEHHSGWITAENTASGVAFSVLLPLRQADAV